MPAITRETIAEINKVVSKAVSELIQDGNFVENIITKVVQKVTESLSPIIEDLEKNHARQINDLRQKNKELTQEIDSIKSTLDHEYQRSKSNNLRIYGISESPKENLRDKMLETFKDKLNTELSLNDINYCFRTGVKKDDRPRAIVVVFTSQYYRERILKNRKMLKGSKIVVREDLVRKVLVLLAHTKTKFGPKNVWVNRGQVFVKKSDNSIIKIQNLREISSPDLAADSY